jgi:hypothetical protein
VSDVTVKSQLEGLAKEVYGDGPENLIPDHARLVKEIPFRESEMLGNAYNVPVVVSDENGVTYAGSTDDAVTLEDPEAMMTKNASLAGSQIIMRAAIGYKAAAAIANKGPKAFLNSTEFIIKRLMSQAGKRLELMHLYGGSGLGQVSNVANLTVPSATQCVLTFTDASWAAGIWIGSTNAKLELFNVSATQVGTTFKVVSVDVPNKKVTVSALAADITAALGASISSPSALGDVFFKGAKGKESLGLDKIITTSGTLFGIVNTTYDLFKGRTFDANSAALDFAMLNEAIVELTNFGLEEEVKVWVNPLTWSTLNEDEAALRHYDQSYSTEKSKKGSKDIEYFSQNGKLVIAAHPFVKQGEAFLVPMDKLKRVGAYDLSMRNPGRNNEMFRELDSRSGFEIRAYTDQALFCDHPSHLMKISGIVNS